MSQILVEVERWRVPIRARLTILRNVEGEHLTYEGQVVPSWIIDGPNAEDDRDRLNSGLACMWCLQTFPCKPGLDSLREWRPHLHWFTDKGAEQMGKTREKVETAILRGCCPQCYMPVNDVISMMMDGGVV